jgi:hypothetical protein
VQSITGALTGAFAVYGRSIGNRFPYGTTTDPYGRKKWIFYITLRVLELHPKEGVRRILQCTLRVQ